MRFSAFPEIKDAFIGRHLPATFLLAPLAIADPIHLDRFENATEWWGGLVFSLYFALLAQAWRRTGFAARLDAGPR